MIGCEPGAIGAMAGGASPSDPIFWVLHPIYEKGLHILELSPSYRDRYDFSWVNGTCDGSSLHDEQPFTGRCPTVVTHTCDPLQAFGFTSGCMLFRYFVARWACAKNPRDDTLQNYGGSSILWHLVRTAHLYHNITVSAVYDSFEHVAPLPMPHACLAFPGALLASHASASFLGVPEQVLGFGSAEHFLTNAELFELFNPANGRLSYMYDSFQQWGTCNDWDPCPECVRHASAGDDVLPRSIPV